MALAPYLYIYWIIFAINLETCEFKIEKGNMIRTCGGKNGHINQRIFFNS